MKAEDKEWADLHRSVAKPAEKLLEGFFSTNHSLKNQNKQRIKVLVPCAGTFPSYPAFLKVLKKQYPEMRMLSLVLVDPFKAHLDTFMRLYPLPETSPMIEISAIPKGALIEKRTIYFTSLAEFIRETSHKFDLVYIEHPQISAVDTCLFSHSRSLRSSLPYLSNVLKPGADVIVACQSREERGQMKKLLTYGFNLTSDHTLHSITTGGSFLSMLPERYSNGITVSNMPILNGDQQRKLSENIKISDRLLQIFAVLSFGLYLLTNFNKGDTFLAGTASLLLFFSQFALHQPGKKGLAVKLTLSALQFSLFATQVFASREEPEFNQRKLGL